MIRGYAKRIENTLYTVMHWVQCFVVVNGILVAKSDEFVINIVDYKNICV